METKVLSFRMPRGWPALLNNTARQYGFTSRSELLQLVITDAALSGRKVKQGNIETPTVVLACRISLATYQAITDIALKGKDTVSAWCAMVVAVWWQDLLKEDARQLQKGIGHTFFMSDYAKKYRERARVYNRNMSNNGVIIAE